MHEQMKILVVDDEQGIRESLQEILQEEGYTVLTAASAAQARHSADSGIDMALIDIKLGEDNGIELLREFKQLWPQVPVVMISGHGTVALTSEAFKIGAHDFMEKPLRLVKVRTTVRNALESVRLRKRVQQQERERFPRPVYRSAVMKELMGQVSRLAGVAQPVVIMGPSGSGKELVAQALHYEGPRADAPFIATNSASMPLNLAEDEIFGHEKGAFTGATSQRIGCLEQAHGGTLFLDEIGDMDPKIQAKLLRVLENGTFTRLGGTTPVKVNVRVVAATHKDLTALVQQGSFRHDLWYRLCAFVLRTPPLSQRPDDIALLAEHFLERTCAEMSIERRFDEQALATLTARDYPGNVRELRHAITRAAVYSNSQIIDQSTIQAALGSPQSTPQPASSTFESYAGLDFRAARNQFELDYLNCMLTRHEGSITATAAAIGMAQSNLSRKLKELGLR